MDPKSQEKEAGANDFNKLATIFKGIMPNLVTAEDFAESFKVLIEAVKRSKVFNDTQMKEFQAFCEKKVNDMEAQNKRAWQAVVKKVNSLKNGNDGKPGEPGYNPMPDIDYPSQSTVVQWVIDEVNKLPKDDPVTSTFIRDKLEELKGDERIDANAIKGLEELFERQGREIEGRIPRFYGGVNALRVRDDDVLVADAGVKELNFTGNGVTVTYDASGKATVDIGGDGSGDVVGPSSATDNAIARFDSTTGKLIQNSNVTISDTGVVAMVETPTVDGNDVYYATGTDVPITDGGTGVSSISAKSIWAANSANVLVELTPGANQSIRMNAANTAWEVYTPISTGGLTWNEVTGTSVSAAVNNAYILNNAGLVTLTIPTTAAVGDVIKVVGKGAGGWTIAQNASENINFGNVTTTTGTGGSLSSSLRYDCVELVCTVANTTWTVTSSIGNITYV